MLDALPTALPFTCTKCGGSGQFRTYGRCSECKGKGGFRSSPEARAKASERAKVRRIHAARAQNQDPPALYLAVIRHADKHHLLRSMRMADQEGTAWTFDQRRTAKDILAEIGAAPRGGAHA